MSSSSSSTCASGEIGSERPAVNSLKDAFDWARHVLAKVLLFRGGTLEAMSKDWFGLKMSTAFSGIGAPEHACQCASFAMCGLLGLDAHDKKHSVHTHSAIERDNLAREEMLSAEFPAAHMFCDIDSFIADSVSSQRLVNSLNEMNWGQIVRWTKQAAAVKTSAFCVVCQQECSLVSCELHCAGPPCTDWSPQGTRGKSMGVTFRCTILWIMMRRVLREAVCIHENVKEFALQILYDTLSDLYVIFSIVMDPVSFGWAGSRTRRYTVMLLKESVMETYVPYDQWTAACERFCAFSWLEYMVGTIEQIESELHWGRQLPTSAFNEENFKGLAEELQYLASESEFTSALTMEMLSFLNGYRLLYKQKGCGMAAMLNQDPEMHPETVSSKQPLFTVISNTPCLCVDQCEDVSRESREKNELNNSDLKEKKQHASHWRVNGHKINRWMAAEEMLLTMGFVTQDRVAAFGEQSSFMRSNASRTRPSMKRQCGNSMHVNCVALAIVWGVLLSKHRHSVKLVVNSESDDLLAALAKGTPKRKVRRFA